MSGIYIHIPFCKQACHYCDFHFSTSLKKKEEIVQALATELSLRKKELKTPVETIYFGGGTPSLLSVTQLQFLIHEIYICFNVVKTPEITLEANPDDLIGRSKLFEAYKSIGINRLSIGVQSFFEEDLTFMNRAHNREEAIQCIKEAKRHFTNFSIDLIYGIPQMNNHRWLKNIENAIAMEVPHISCYALTVEPKTALKTFIEKGIVAAVDDQVAQEHHELLLDRTKKAGYDNYEFSNFGKPGMYSQNNMAYWKGKPYLGIGPSAHSYDGDCRSWNIANNTLYIKEISNQKLPLEREKLSNKDKYNEYVMTRLRTMWGVSVEEIKTLFGTKCQEYLLKQSKSHIINNTLILENGFLKVTPKGKFLSDGIASDLFLLNLN